MSSPCLLPSVVVLLILLGFVPAPLKNIPLVSGKLNVVDPSPAPYATPIAANKSAYVVLDTADPSHSKVPGNADAFPQGIIVPTALPEVCRPIIFAISQT
jgi:hypothetical protein